MLIPVVDVFAGPGGLGEGFSAYSPNGRSKNRPFKIAISAEMEVNAAKTLRLRAFFRQFEPGKAPASYYDYVGGRADQPWTEATKAQWIESGEEARQLQLGVPKDDKVLHDRIKQISAKGDPWILIGGPPCQAYSLVGRARNKGISDYKPEEDHRHFLYKHYLKILKDHRPAAFVMENVKGILSSKVGGELMFPKILADLHAPGGKGGPRYRIIPMIKSDSGTLFNEEDGRRYILRAEELGVPQARHRVVLLGVLEDIDVSKARLMVPSLDRVDVSSVIRNLPRLRSGLTDVDFDSWSEEAQAILAHAAKLSEDREVATELKQQIHKVTKTDPGSGSRTATWTSGCSKVPPHLEGWLLDPKLAYLLNHEVRQHMWMDLVRYAYASAFTLTHGKSPRGSSEFPEAMHPAHANWSSGKFVDRFKVQQWKGPSSTVTSHLSKDGHYFIHPDPSQLRSLSVREAARLQTFPDNYFFEGSRGAQFRQVGNAVPPWMANQIADVVYSILES
ncbi:DNA (cytosine-5-)-methyltransferase [uncultured Stenotrophomonas sp.]|uniref:DNA cytosine methyltransferase n=1 Tax=uncultured Stenotrophomonas sp. TaxID=165438 RepID=UPI0028E344DB|nr:DNA (cytosine-5-)-methyltransferase [uncultured Stenotrophomonas sp.]